MAKRSKPKDSSSVQEPSSNLPQVSKQTAGGVTGAVMGGVVAGPVGAIAGGVVGAIIGDASAEGKQPIKKAVDAIRAKVPAMKKALRRVPGSAKLLGKTTAAKPVKIAGKSKATKPAKSGSKAKKNAAKVAPSKSPKGAKRAKNKR